VSNSNGPSGHAGALPATLTIATYLIVPDTSSLLDVVRMAVREQNVADPVSVRTVISAASGAMPFVEFALIDIVRKEFEDKLEATNQYVTNQLQQLANDIDRVARGLARLRHLADETPAVHVSDVDWIEQAAERSLNLAKDMIAVSFLVAITPEDLALAHQRTLHARAPAQRGSVSTVDSQLMEAALRLAVDRPSQRTIFVTSNDKDFRLGTALHPDLQADFEDAGLLYARTWAEVVGLIQ
jgi:hypothetical protein